MSESAAPSGFSPAEEAELRAFIVEERARTADQIEALSRDFDEIAVSADTVNIDDEHDPEGSTIAFERAQIISLLQQARENLEFLDQALEQLDNGTFGICERCGQRIAFERLMARPTAHTCVSCAAATAHWPLR